MDGPIVTETGQTQKPPTVADIAKWREPVEAIAKTCVTIVGIAYVIGLLILNLHIGQYGVHYLGFFQIEYVMTGAACSFLFGFTFSIFFLVKFQMQDIYNNAKNIPKGMKILPRMKILSLTFLIMIGIISASFFTLSWILFILSDRKLTPMSLAFWIAFVQLFFSVMLIYGSAKFRRKIIAKILVISSESDQVKKETKYQSYVDACNIIMLCLVLLGGYARAVFPQLSPAFGGGKMQLSEFIINRLLKK